jgi:hypothetical protein
MVNRQGRSLAGALFAPILLLAAAPALGQDVTVYGTEAEYDAAAGAADFCLDFNGSTGAFVDGGSFSADVVFGSPEAAIPPEVNWSSDAISDAGSMLSPNGVGNMDVTFTGTAMAFKFTFLSNGVAATVDLYAADATLIASVTAPNAPGFFGVITTVPVKRALVTPGFFDPALGTRDRFFIDDFCATAVVSNEPPPPPPATDLDAMCADFAAAVAAADGSAFRGHNRQRALAHKLRVVCRRVEAGDAESLCSAIRKLERDVLPKMDGDRGPTDWVTDATVQQALEDQANALIAALEEELAALGGCPSDRGHDDGDGEGNGHGRGRGRGHNK